MAFLQFFSPRSFSLQTPLPLQAAKQEWSGPSVSSLLLLSSHGFSPSPVWALYRPPSIQVIAICSGRGSSFMGLSALPQQPNSSFSDVFFSIASHFFLSFALSSVFYHFLNTLFLEVLPALLRGLVVPCIGLLRTICNWLYLNHKSPASQDSFKLLSQRHICCQNFTRITSCTYRALVGLWFKYP